MEALFHTDSLAAKIGFTIGVVALITIASHFLTAISNARALSKYPIANEKWDAEAKKHFTQSAGEVLAKGVALVCVVLRF